MTQKTFKEHIQLDEANYYKPIEVLGKKFKEAVRKQLIANVSSEFPDAYGIIVKPSAGISGYEVAFLTGLKSGKVIDKKVKSAFKGMIVEGIYKSKYSETSTTVETEITLNGEF